MVPFALHLKCWGTGLWNLLHMIHYWASHYRCSTLLFSGPLSSLLPENHPSCCPAPPLSGSLLCTHHPIASWSCRCGFAHGILDTTQEKRCFHIMVNLLQSEQTQKQNILKMPSIWEECLFTTQMLHCDLRSLSKILTVTLGGHTFWKYRCKSTWAIFFCERLLYVFFFPPY